MSSFLSKTRITVIHKGKAESVSWYEDVTPSEIERLIRQVFELPSYTKILLRDLDGDAVVVSPHLPNNRTFTLVTEEEKEKERSSLSASYSYTSPTKSSSYLQRSSSPYKSPRFTSPVGNSSSFSPRPTSSSPMRTSRISLGSLEGSPMRTSYTSPSKNASASLAKEVLNRIDKLRNFEKRVRELREEKFREFFELSVVTGSWAWKKDVTSGEFMSAISTDLYWNAGACGLLSSKRKEEIDRILNGALSAYMDSVRELGRQGNFEAVVSLDAGFARDTLKACYDEVVNVVQQIIHEKIHEAEIYTRDSM